MAEALMRHHRLLAGAALFLATAGANAQSLQDPTRPGSAAAGGSDPAASAGPQLQSVLVSRRPGGRQVAVIDGDTVRLGETYKGARVARITQTEVELVRGKERQVLRLLPAEEIGVTAAGR